MTHERFNEIMRLFDEHYPYLKTFTCESYIDPDESIINHSVIFHLSWVPDQLTIDLDRMGFGSSAFPEGSATLALWISDMMIHYNSTPKV